MGNDRRRRDEPADRLADRIPANDPAGERPAPEELQPDKPPTAPDGNDRLLAFPHGRPSA